MTPDQVLTALTPGVQLFFSNRGYNAAFRLAEGKLRITVQKPGMTAATRDFPCPPDNAILTTQLDAWYEELEGAAE